MTDNLSKRLFEIENTEEILSFKTYDGAPIWMFARYYYLYLVMGQKLINLKSPERIRKVNSKMISTIFRMIFHNIFKGKIETSIVFYSTNRKTMVNGKYFNRYVDQLASVFPKESCVIEQATLDWEWPSPRYNNNVYYDSIGRIMSEIKGRLFYKRDYEATYELMKFVSKRTKVVTGIELGEDELEHITKYISRFVSIMRFQAKWLDKKIGNYTKIFIMVGAGFPFNYFINKNLKQRGIKTIELQHGYITSTNFMYNYADKIKAHKDVKEGLPEYMFTYGQWWSSQTNSPMQCINIGNPYRDNILADRIGDSNEKEKLITIISIGENVESTLNLALFIKEHVKEYIVKYRPHPGEMEIVEKIISEKGYDISIDKDPEIYNCLYKSEVIIGEVSTVLFEAVGIVDRIIAWNTEYTKLYFPSIPFEKMEEMNEIVELLGKEGIGLNFEDFWDGNWRENYQLFINRLKMEKK